MVWIGFILLRIGASGWLCFNGNERDGAKVNVWCALSCSEILGSILFAEQTVTAMTYLDMLQLYL
jgi:hypothetical protein